METFKLISAQERKESLEVLATWKACQKNKNEPSDEVTIISYAFHYVPLVMFVLSILMLVLLNEGVFAFCSSEIVSEIWVWTVGSFIGSIVSYVAVRTSTKDVDLVKYKHIPLMNIRRKRVIQWCEKFESPAVQLERLKTIFEYGTLVEVFLKQRDKDTKKRVLNYISITDVNANKCIVRKIAESVYYKDDMIEIENAKIVASYKSLEDLVADGWIINEEMYD